MNLNTLSIGIGGASGKLGAATLRELRARSNGEHLVGISRTPDKIVGANATRRGDYDEPEALVTAYAGLNRLLLIPSVELRPGKRGEQNVAAIDAAVAAGVNHIILLSSVGTYDVAEPDILASYYRAEQRLIQTAPAWTILRMTSFSEEFVREAQLSLSDGTLVGLGENRVSFVSRADVAASAAAVMLGKGHEGATYNLTGPDSLTSSQRAQLIAQVSGTPMRFVAVAKDVLDNNLRGLGLPDYVVNAVLSIQQHFAEGAFDIATGDVERLAGKIPLGLLEVLRSGFGGNR